MYLEETTSRLKEICGVTQEEGRSPKAITPSNGHDDGKQFIKLSDVKRLLEETLPARLEKLVDKAVSKARGHLD